MTGKSVLKKKTASKKHISQATHQPHGSTPTGDSTDSSQRWTFLTNHAHVLAVLYSDPQPVLRQVAIAVGITERAVQRIVQDLEQGGFIQREKVGRQNRYRVFTDQSLRHPIEAHRNIGDLLKLINK